MADAPDRRWRKSERLLRRADFLRVQRNGLRYRGSCLIFLHLPSPLGRRRIGFTVSTRVGNAPTRNRIKRCLREICREHKQRFPADADVVIIARGGASGASFEQLSAEVVRWLDQLDS